VAYLYIDEDVPRSVAVRLRELGHDVLTVREAGKDGQSIPDDEVLAFAREQGRAVVTKNRKHFDRLHSRCRAEGLDHPGIITFTEDLNYEALASRIHEAIGGQMYLINRLIKVIRPQT
jgi:predicted nuclease of predicted toxin-antitoxin system